MIVSFFNVGMNFGFTDSDLTSRKTDTQTYFATTIAESVYPR